MSSFLLDFLVLLSIFSLFVWSVDCNLIVPWFNTTMQKSGRATTFMQIIIVVEGGDSIHETGCLQLYILLSVIVMSLEFSFLFIGIHIYN